MEYTEITHNYVKGCLVVTWRNESGNWCACGGGYYTEAATQSDAFTEVEHAIVGDTMEYDAYDY